VKEHDIPPHENSARRQWLGTGADRALAQVPAVTNSTLANRGSPARDLGLARRETPLGGRARRDRDAGELARRGSCHVWFGADVTRGRTRCRSAPGVSAAF
jgi:hypothetical protein